MPQYNKVQGVTYDMRHEKRIKKLKSKDEPLFDDQGNYRATCHDLKTDFLILLEQYYVGNVKDEGDHFILSFDNGQRFRIDIDELDYE